MLEREVLLPEPSEEACQRHYAANKPQHVIDQAVHLRHILFAVTPGVDVQKLAQRADMKAFASYIEARKLMKDELAKRDNKSLAKNPDLQGAWNAFTAGLVKNNIGFEQVYNRILEADTIQGEVLS